MTRVTIPTTVCPARPQGLERRAIVRSDDATHDAARSPAKICVASRTQEPMNSLPPIRRQHLRIVRKDDVARERCAPTQCPEDSPLGDFIADDLFAGSVLSGPARHTHDTAVGQAHVERPH